MLRIEHACRSLIYLAYLYTVLQWNSEPGVDEHGAAFKIRFADGLPG